MLIRIDFSGNLRKSILALLVVLIGACTTVPVTGRHQFMLIPEREAIAASVPAYFKMLSKPARDGKLDNDPALQARVELIASRLIAQALRIRPDTANWQWSIHIIDEPKTVNAWAMAGGRMALYSGLVKRIKPSDDELAQVLGHEISHALAKHTAEQMSVALAANLALATWAASGDHQGLALTGASLAAVLAVKLPNSRQAEREADRIGIELAARAGYDPHAVVSLWIKMKQASPGGRMPEFLSTHPAPDARLATLRSLVPQMMRYYKPQLQHPVYHFKAAAEKLPREQRVR